MPQAYSNCLPAPSIPHPPQSETRLSFLEPTCQTINPQTKPYPEYIAYLALLTAHIVLVWYLPYFPSQDGPSHLYNLVILQDLLNGGKTWGNIFSHQLHAVPNLGFNLVAYPLLNLFHPLVVEKIFISFYIVLMGISVPVFLRSFNKPPLPLAFCVFPVIFNFTLLMGFYSFVMAIPLFLLAFSLAWKIRYSSTASRFIIYNLSGFVLYYFHLIPFVFFILSLIAIVIMENALYKDKILGLAKLSLLISPTIFLLYTYLANTTSSHLDLSYLLSLKRYLYLFSELLMFSTVSISKLQMIPASILLYITLTLFTVSIRSYLDDIRLRIGFLNSDKVLMLLLLELGLIYIFAPFSFGDGSLFNQRFPWIIFIITLPILKLPDNIFFRRFFSAAIVCVVTAFFIVNILVLQQESSKVDNFLKGLKTNPPKRAFLMTYKTETPVLYPVWSRVDVLMHAASYYGIFMNCIDIGNYETGLNYFPVHFKENLPAFPSPDQIAWKPTTIDFSNYPSIQYILGWEVNDTDKEKLGKFFNLIQNDGLLTIWVRKI